MRLFLAHYSCTGTSARLSRNRTQVPHAMRCGRGFMRMANWQERPRRVAQPSPVRAFDLVQKGRAHELRDSVRMLLDPHAEEMEKLSPSGHLHGIGVPVCLLHEQHDLLIPSTELEWANLELESRPHATLISPLVEHVEVNRPAGPLDKLARVQFMASLL
jgi:hypothetical protein